MECSRCHRKLPVKEQDGGVCADSDACRKRLERRFAKSVGSMRSITHTPAWERSAYQSAPKLGDS